MSSFTKYILLIFNCLTVYLKQQQNRETKMKKISASIVVFAACLMSSSSFAAESYLASPAFVRQATGAGFSSLDTSAIMKPAFSMMAAVPSFTAPTSGNLANTLQIGDFNVANIEQGGVGNVGLIQQIGYSNTASISQEGGAHQAFISQQGRNNVAIIHQR